MKAVAWGDFHGKMQKAANEPLTKSLIDGLDKNSAISLMNEMSEKENSNFVTEKALAFAKSRDKKAEQKDTFQQKVNKFKNNIGPQVGE